MLNGDGLRVVLWVSGCNHHCKNCHNPITWDANEGVFFDENAEKEIYQELEKEYTNGVTFSGGDPLFPDNRNTITLFAQKIKKRFPLKTIWCYTGYLWEEVKELEVIKQIDVLVDGRFIEELADPQLHWKGSSNQRVIDVQKTLKTGKIMLRP